MNIIKPYYNYNYTLVSIVDVLLLLSMCVYMSQVEDARAAMALYQTHKKEWESGCITVNPHKKTAQDS